MTVKRLLRWAVQDFREGWSALDPSKLMVAPILFIGILTVLDRGVYETEQWLFPGEPERMTRL